MTKERTYRVVVLVFMALGVVLSPLYVLANMAWTVERSREWGGNDPFALFGWVGAARRALGPLLGFSGLDVVERTYGRLLLIVYMGLAPAVLLLRARQGARPEADDAPAGSYVRAGTIIALVGAVFASLGTFLDYGFGQRWGELMFMYLTIEGCLFYTIGGMLIGFGVRSTRLVPPWCAWVLILSSVSIFFPYMASALGTASDSPAWALVGLLSLLVWLVHLMGWFKIALTLKPVA